MSAKIRFFEKKRGGRRTGSRFAGTVVEALFYLGLLIAGCGLLVWILVSQIYPHWGANRYFRETRATVLERRIVERHQGDAQAYRPDIHVRYEVQGAEYRTWTYSATRVEFPDRQQAEEALEPFPVHAERPIYYDPMEPTKAVLVRDLSGAGWVLLLFPGAMIVLGSVGLAYRVTTIGQSTERRAALDAKRKNVELFDETPSGPTEWPAIPSDHEITNSPGTKLAYRLPIDTSAGWILAGTVIVCAVWNVAAALLGSVALRDHLAGNPNWLLTSLTLPFVAAGVWLVVHVIRLWVNTTGVGPPRVEISAHPLAPGGKYSLYLFLPQSGQLRFDAFTMSLICEERAVYRLGTDAQTMTQRVYERLIFGADETTVRHAEAYETDGSFTIPDTAMHSFRGKHNGIEWKLLLRGRIKGWPDYERAFTIVVYPRRPPGERR